MRRAWLALMSLPIAGCPAENTAPAQAPERPVAAEASVEADDAGATEAEPPPASDATVEKEVETLKGSYEAQNAHDADAVAAFYAQDAVVKWPGLPDWSGRATIRLEEEKNFAELTDAKWGVRRILVKDEVAIVEWTATGTVAAVVSKKTAAKRFGANGVSVMWFSPDALIKEEHDYLNMPTVNAQTKAAPKGTAREILLQPSGTPDVRTAQGTPDETKNLGVGKALTRSFDARDEKGFSDLIADDVVWDDFTAPLPLTGRTDTAKMFQTTTTALPDMKTVCQAWAVEDLVAQECTRSATHEGILHLGALKVPPTHAHMTVHFVDVLLVKSGKIAKAWRYADNTEVAAQIGLVKPTTGTWTDAVPAKKKKPQEK
jgi:ketosteroid isomerase-like protein